MPKMREKPALLPAKQPGRERRRLQTKEENRRSEDRPPQWKRMRSQVAFLGFVEQMIGGAPGEGHDGERRVFVRIGDERRAVHDEKIFDVVGPAEAIEDGGLRIGAHPGGADLVDDFSAFVNAKGILAVDGSLGAVFTAGSFDDGAESVLHVFGLAKFVFRPLEMEAQNGNAPLVHDFGIDFAVGVGVGEHFAAAREADGGAVDLAAALLQGCAVAFLVMAEPIEHSDARHVAAAPEFNVITAGEIVLAVEFPPRDVHVHSADAVVIVRRHFFELGEMTPAVTADGVGGMHMYVPWWKFDRKNDFPRGYHIELWGG